MKKILLAGLLFLSANAYAFTQAELNLLKTAVLAEPTIAACVSAGDDGCVANWLNAPSTFVAWKSTTNKDDIFDNVIWANFTPANPSAGAGQDASNWMLACQGKALNLQTLLNTQSIRSDKLSIRAGIQDATTGIPSGVNGANKSGGWTAINLVMQRLTTNAEKVLATGTGTTAVPGLMTFEGQIQAGQVYLIMGRV